MIDAGALDAWTRSLRACGAAWRRFIGERSAATAIEYALIASGISIVIAGAVVVLGTNVTAMFTQVATALQ
jgi:pilus assembly protein Flp/PilA